MAIIQDGCLPVTPARSVVNPAGIFDAELARHDLPLPPRRIWVKSKERELSGCRTGDVGRVGQDRMRGMQGNGFGF
ncbi:MAG: hypothetical protein EXS31_13095 [Pedosphaera sp.]|nr:hypothetical protein [Pedosphaera sp.]